MSSSVYIRTPVRLHFGLLSFGELTQRRFGGAGVMVGPPYLELGIEGDDTFRATGAMEDRVTESARRWCDFHGKPWPLPCRIHVSSAPPQHVGLGVGSQLALSVAALLAHFFEIGPVGPQEMALSVGRGLRSAVGTHGFARGGLIVDRGKAEGDAIGELACQIAVPDEWRFVLVRPHVVKGLSGPDEKRAFATLPAVNEETHQSLVSLLHEQLVPATASGDFDTFSESLYCYGRTAGECFASEQGGAYNGPVLTELVEAIRGLGVHGVGQSSWGPTLFAVTSSEEDARRLTYELTASFPSPALTTTIARVNNDGACLRADGPLPPLSQEMPFAS